MAALCGERQNIHKLLRKFAAKTICLPFDTVLLQTEISPGQDYVDSYSRMYTYIVMHCIILETTYMYVCCPELSFLD